MVSTCLHYRWCTNLFALDAVPEKNLPRLTSHNELHLLGDKMHGDDAFLILQHGHLLHEFLVPWLGELIDVDTP